MPDDLPPIVLVRVRFGLIGETKRVVHVVPVPDPSAAPDELIAYCGERFLPGTLELHSGPTGMPCVRCLRYAPLPHDPELPPGQ